MFGFDLPVNGTVLLFTLLASALTGIAVGLLPAWIATRTDVNAALKQGARGATGDRSRHRLRQALIVLELALALVLLSGAGYFVRGMQRLAHADMGWKPDGLVTAVLSLPYNCEVRDRRPVPGLLRQAGRPSCPSCPAPSRPPSRPRFPSPDSGEAASLAIEGRPPAPQGKAPLTYYNSVTPGHFATLGMRVVAGRDFTEADRADSLPVAIINESMARLLWPGQSVIGKRSGIPTRPSPTGSRSSAS